MGAEGSRCTLALQDLLSAPHRNIVLRSNAGGLPTGSHFTSQSDFPKDTTKECSGQAGGRDSENAFGYFYAAVSGQARVWFQNYKGDTWCVFAIRNVGVSLRTADQSEGLAAVLTVRCSFDELVMKTHKCV